jgi:hypothetical protein
MTNSLTHFFEAGNPFQGYRILNCQTLQRRLSVLEAHTKELYNARLHQADDTGAADKNVATLCACSL